MQLSKLTYLVELGNSIQDQLFITVSLKRFNEINFIRVDTNFFLKRFYKRLIDRTESVFSCDQVFKLE